MTRLYVDKNRCEGSRLCVLTHPDGFAFGDDGYADVIDESWASTLTHDEVEAVITLCPADAIRRVRDDEAP